MTAGESHGPALVAVLDGLPSGVRVTTSDVARDLGRRRLGYGRGARMKFEQDAVELTDADGVIEACGQHGPHVVLLDLDLGGGIGDGTALIEPLVEAGARVVILTGSTDDARLGNCLELGAVGVIAKAEPLEFLVEPVRLAARGEWVLPAQRRLDLLLESRRERAAREQRLAPFEALTVITFVQITKRMTPTTGPRKNRFSHGMSRTAEMKWDPGVIP